VIVCKDCGHKNQNATTFCEACGTFLEWAGESVLTGAHQAIPSPDAPPVEGSTPLAPATPPPPAVPPPPPEPTPAAPPAEPAGAAFQAQRLPVISAPDAGEPLAPAVPPTPPAEEPAAAAPPPPPAETPPAEEPRAPAAARPGTQVLRAMRMKARPPAPPAPAAPVGPAARPPGEEHERRPPKPPSAEAPRPQGNAGDIFCSSCGTPNDPTRHYCRSCGSPLAGAVAGAAVAAPRAPWWKRIFGRGAGDATPAPAGTRPTGKGGRRGRSTVGAGGNAINSVAHVARRFFQIVALLGALGIAVVAIGPWRTHAKAKVRGWIDDARAIVQPRYVEVTPTKISASSSLRNNPPQNAFDGIIETFWAEAAHGDGTGQALTVTFAKATDLARVGFTVGDQKDPQAFATRPVPRTLTVVFYDANGAVVKREQVSLEQTPKFQKRDAGAKGVTRVVITIASTYPPVKGSKSSASIAEIELFKKE
jgi:hypothetical protein